MTQTQTGGNAAADDDLRPIVDGHTQEIRKLHGRLDGVEGEVRSFKSGQDAMMERLISVEAQGQERERNRAQDRVQDRSALTSLAQQIAKLTGAQEERNRQSQERTQTLKRLSIWIGIMTGVLGMIGATLFSSQTFDTAFWGHFRTRPHIEAQINATPNH